MLSVLQGLIQTQVLPNTNSNKLTNISQNRFTFKVYFFQDTIILNENSGTKATGDVHYFE